MTSDLIIVGGGLAGLMAAHRAESFGLAPILVDEGVNSDKNELGGFAAFSGAKFSLFPAGSGLTNLTGSTEALIERYARVCREFADLGFPQFEVSRSEIVGRNIPLDGGGEYRSYHSIVLTPIQIDGLLERMSARLVRTHIIRESVAGLAVDGGAPFHVQLACGETLKGARLIVAAGRLGSELLKNAGVAETRGKGIDVGVRLSFDSLRPLENLRNLGPDAKFMSDGVRTFCLNSPGRIFHYPGAGYQLPGGVVAEPTWTESNVGILYRLPDRTRVIERLKQASPRTGEKMCQDGSFADLGWSHQSVAILGEEVSRGLDIFVRKLIASGLVDLPSRYTVHYPLLDWHWPVFSLPGSLATDVPGVLAVGDASGHARGLMQAAVMGSLGVEEFLN